MARDDFDFDNYTPEGYSGRGRNTNPGRYSRDYSDAYEQVRAQKKKKRRRARRRRAVLTILLVILILAAVCGIVFGIRYFIGNGLSDDTDADGTVSKSAVSSGGGVVYSREVDITREIAANIALWLSDIEGTDIDTDYVKDRCGEFKVRSSLTLYKDGFNKGTYEEAFDEASYNELQKLTDSVIDSILNEIIAERLVEAGYAETVTPEEAAVIVSSVLGSDASSYIKDNNVSLVPNLEKLSEEYGMSSGEYSISKGMITFTDSVNGSKISENLIRKKNSLVLVDSNRVYVREDAE